VEVAVAGESVGGRPIHAVTVTAGDVADDDKQHVLLVAGQHGNEESGRMLALATMDWLVSRAGAATRRRQKIVIMPCVNPDGAAADIHNTPAGVAPNLDHGPAGPTSPEGQAVEDVADALRPELFVDMHARGYTGFSYDMILWPDSKPYTEDDNVLHALAAEMAAAGEAGGIPQVSHPLTWPGWGEPGFDQPSTTCWMYRNFKSIVFLTESAEANRIGPSAEVRMASALAKIRALLAHGNRRHRKLYYEGYPCFMTAGMFVCGIVAVGQTAAQRRHSRIDAWRNRAAFTKLDRELPEQALHKRLHLQYDGELLPAGVGVQSFTTGKCQVVSVRVNGRALRPGETDGWYAWHDVCATYVVAALPDLRRGQYVIDIRLR
jgi:hypothetical protein